MNRLAIVAILLAAGLTALVPVSAPSDAHRSKTTHVTDGDTAYFKPLNYGSTAASWPGRKARFIGIDAPEWHSSPRECYAGKAKRFVERKLDGKRVKITYGEDPVDQYDRALVYIWRKGKLFNRKLVRRGFAVVSTYQPNDRYESRLIRAEAQAKEEGLGLWGACG